MALASIISLTLASAAASADAITELDRITVTATREAREVGEVSATVTVIEREDIERQLAQDLRELFRYEPGIFVPDAGGRFGLSGITIRGIGGNRVALEVDGVALPDAFAIGSFSDQGRDAIDLDQLKRVEVVRGPSSSLYGSDALGGVVSFITKDPLDYLDLVDDHDTLWAKAGHATVDDSTRLSGLFAAGDASASALVSVSQREGHERENQGETGGTGATRTKRDPLDYTDRSLLTKLLWGQDGNVGSRLTLDFQDGRSDSDLLSQVRQQSATVETTALTGDDASARLRASFDQDIALTSALADRIRWQVYRQTSETEQRTHEERVVTSQGVTGPRVRERRFQFDQTETGTELVFSRSFEGAVAHTLTYGLDAVHTRTEELRDGYELNLLTGTVSKTVLPDTFPVRDFPASDTLEAGLFVQDEIAFADGAFVLVPALRVDYYDLDPKPDALFVEDNPGFDAAGITETEISPKLGFTWTIADGWAVVGQYAEGFRAPPYNDVNLGFTNFIFGYTALPNPDLKPESSQGAELGLRWRGDVAHVAVTAYYNRYEDFIDSLAFVGIDPATGLVQFQSVNRERVTIKGAELRAGLDFGAFAESFDGLSLNAALAWSEGTDESTDEALDSVDPARATLGLRYQRGGWSTELAGRFADRHDDVPESIANPFVPGGYGVLDLLVSYAFGANAAIDLGVFNLADRTYWEWGNVVGRGADDAALLRYSEPGRTYSAQIRWQW